MHLTWKRSIACTGGACVEVAFGKSSYSGGNGCVEVGHDDGRVLVRDSKDHGIEPISFQRSEWMNTVLAPVMLGRLPSFVHELPEGGFEWRGHTVEHAEQWLTFTVEEWEAFCSGVKAGEFNPPPRSEVDG